MNRRFLLSTAGAALMSGALWTPAMAEDAAPADGMAEAAMLFTDDMVLGNPDSPVEVLEYGSFTCPHCREFHESFFKQLKADYIDTGKIRFVYREMVRNRMDIWASLLARCGDGLRYEPMNSLIFDKQAEWAGSGDPATIAASLRTLGKVAGFSDAQLDQCLTNAPLAEAILAKSEEEAKRDQVEGTPTIFLNGEKLALSTYAAFTEAIDAKLAE